MTEPRLQRRRGERFSYPPGGSLREFSRGLCTRQANTRFPLSSPAGGRARRQGHLMFCHRRRMGRTRGECYAHRLLLYNLDGRSRCRRSRTIALACRPLLRWHEPLRPSFPTTVQRGRKGTGRSETRGQGCLTTCQRPGARETRGNQCGGCGASCWLCRFPC